MTKSPVEQPTTGERAARRLEAAVKEWRHAYTSYVWSRGASSHDEQRAYHRCQRLAAILAPVVGVEAPTDDSWTAELDAWWTIEKIVEVREAAARHYPAS